VYEQSNGRESYILLLFKKVNNISVTQTGSEYKQSNGRESYILLLFKKSK